ncbi:MAG TPA: GyrI-like domain-containing protein [Saprospiraceae bacterium]|nr:GyrI-like domain-containing protein [Saprospiraceae bacterium]
MPPAKPVLTEVPALNYFVIEGTGNPNDEAFAEFISVLYSLSYGVKMSPKKNMTPDGYLEYSVYPLEGIWDMTQEARKHFSGTIDKDALVFQLMIRQPEFVSTDFAQMILEHTKKKKPHPLLEKVRFETFTEGSCIQMMHLGSFDNEPESFRIMESFADEMKLHRKSKVHKEIYLSDVRKVSPDKLKTVLRFGVEKAI